MVLLLLLGGCSGSVSLPEVSLPGQKAPEPPPAPGRSAAEPLAPPDLTPMPTAGQVASAVPVGRSDPFLPLGANAGSPQQQAAPMVLPEGFAFQGVLLAGGVPQALVQFGGESGSVRPGDRGGPANPLLPPGWRVAAIDVARGRLTLTQNGQRLVVDL
jgi:hypothetical protein